MKKATIACSKRRLEAAVLLTVMVNLLGRLRYLSQPFPSIVAEASCVLVYGAADSCVSVLITLDVKSSSFDGAFA